MTRLDWSRASRPNPDPGRVIEVGEGWARDQVVVKRRKSGKQGNNSVRKQGQASLHVAPFIIPLKSVKLLKSIMRDLGRALPKKRNRLNNSLKKLIDEGVISKEGEPIRSHPIFQEWIDILERRKLR